MKNKQFAGSARRLECIKTCLNDWTKHYFSLTTVTENLGYLSQNPETHKTHNSLVDW